MLWALVLWTGCAARRPPVAPGPPDPTLGPPEDCAVWESASLQRALDRKTESTERRGNAVTLLDDATAAWARRVENTRDADLVLIKTFIWSDDEVGRAAEALLVERARAGAIVVVQYDFKGSMEGLGDLLAAWGADGDAPPPDLPHMARLAAAGVHVVPTNVPRKASEVRRVVRETRDAHSGVDASTIARFRSLDHLDHLDHEKYWITGKMGAGGQVELTAITGGRNIASEYAYGGTTRVDAGTGRGGWRDTDVEVRGPVVEDIVRRFFDGVELNRTLPVPGLVREQWQVPQTPVGDARVRFVWNQPALGTGRRVDRAYRLLLRDMPAPAIARVETAYFAPGPSLRREMARTLRRGGRLLVLTNSPGSTDMQIVAAASRAAYRQLLDTSPSVALYEWRARPDLGFATFHGKSASFGACGPVVVGSANLDGLSTRHNSESVLLVRDPAFRVAYDAMVERDLSEATSSPVSSGDLAASLYIEKAWALFVYTWLWSWLDG